MAAEDVARSKFDVATLSKERDELSESVKTLTKSREALAGGFLNSHLSSEIDALRMDAATLSATVAELHSLNDDLASQLDESRLRITKMTSSLETAQAEIKELGTVRTEAALSSTSVLELQGINDGLKEQLDESRSRISDLTFSLETAQAEIKELVTVQKEAALSIDAVVELQSEKRHVSERMIEADSENDALSAERDAYLATAMPVR